MEADIDITAFYPDRPGIRKVLGDLEAEVMELIWERPVGQGLIVRAVHEMLYEKRRIAYTTVMSSMERLAKKKLLRVEKQDQAYVYYPTCTQQEFTARFVHRILEDLLVNFASELQYGLATSQDGLTASQIRRLYEEITRRRWQEEREEGRER